MLVAPTKGSNPLLSATSPVGWESMENLSEYIDFVKTQVTFHESKAAHFEKYVTKFPINGKRAESHRRMAAKFTALLGFLDAHSGRSMPSKIGPVLNSRLGLSPEEIDGLPPELLEELSISEADKADFAVLSVVDDAGGVLSLDKMLIALYRKTGEIHKRASLNARVYRMVTRGTMFNVPGRKGVYSTRQMTEEEAAALS